MQLVTATQALNAISQHKLRRLRKKGRKMRRARAETLEFQLRMKKSIWVNHFQNKPDYYIPPVAHFVLIPSIACYFIFLGAESVSQL